MNQKHIIYLSLEAALVGITCFVAGNSLSSLVNDGKGSIDGLWCMISALVVLQSLINDSLTAAKSRIIGTIIGSAVAGSICIIFGYSYLSIALSIALCVYILNLMKSEDGARIATSTAALISGYGFIEPEYSSVINAVMRSADTFIGVFISIIIVYISYKLKIRKLS